MRISDWSSDVCSSDLLSRRLPRGTWRMHVVEARRNLPHTDSRLERTSDRRFTSSVICDLGSNGEARTTLTPTRTRSEERRVGKEWVSPCRSRWSQYH